MFGQNNQIYPRRRLLTLSGIYASFNDANKCLINTLTMHDVVSKNGLCILQSLTLLGIYVRHDPVLINVVNLVNVSEIIY